MNVPHSRENTLLFGHDAPEAALRDAWASGRMPHAWLVSGEKGIGKATLCYRFARAVLGEDGGAARRIVAGSHADFLVVEPEFDAKKDEAKREISVEQARALSAFLSMTAGEGGWRVAIVDSADELNTNAANAILKTVEEPPPRALLLLVSHNPGRLLPTIRSRCRALKIPPLSADAFAQAMRALAPELEAEDIAALGRLSSYSPGVALELRALEGLELYDKILSLMSRLPALPAAEVQALTGEITGDKPHARWQMMSRLILRTLALAAGAGTPSQEEIPAVATMRRQWSAATWAERHAQAQQQFSLAARLHLDYKTVLAAFFHALPQPVMPWKSALFT